MTCVDLIQVRFRAILLNRIPQVPKLVPVAGEKTKMPTRKDLLDTLSNFQQAHREEFGIRRIGLFGSAARNELTENSDVDIVVELEQPNLLVLIGIKQELENLFGRPVDVVRYREHMNPLLKHRIEQDAVYA